MNIANTLRQECMPEMIYAICKLAASKSYDKDELKRLITLGSHAKESSDQYNKVYNFAIACEFMSEDNIIGKVSVNFSNKELESFRSYRYAIFGDIFKKSNNMFTELARWYLTQDSDVFAIKSTGDFLRSIPQDLGIRNEEFLLGFRFWMVSLGLATLQKSGAGSTLVFSTNNILLDFLQFYKPFKKGKTILAREFFQTLINECPVFQCCLSGNDVNLALSLGLRVLHINENIELKYTTDSGDIWHLTNSISNPKTNHITEIIVR